MDKKNLRFLWRTLLCGLTFAAFCYTAPSAIAEDGWDEEEEVEEGEEEEVVLTWDERKKEMEAKMEAQINQRRSLLQQQVTAERAAQQIEGLVRRRIKDPQLGDFQLLRLPGITLDWKKFNRTPAKSLQEIVEQVGEDAETYAEDRLHPEEQKRAIRRQAEERFKMVKINERVSLLLRGGRGANAIVDNQPFRGANDEYVQLGNRQVIREDLDREDQAKFYPDVNAELKEAFITNNCGKVDVEYESLVSAYIYNNTAEQFRANFYVPDISKPTANLRTAKPEFWLPMKDFVERVRTNLINRAIEQYKATELPQWMQEQGYFLVDKVDGTGKEWVDEEEKTAREFKPEQNNMMGPDGMMMGPDGMPMGGPGMMPPGGQMPYRR